jgi:hypothetical protein
MDEQGEAQLLLRDTLRKIESTKRALGRSELEAHSRIDSMVQYIHTYLGDAIAMQQPQVPPPSPLVPIIAISNRISTRQSLPVMESHAWEHLVMECAHV